MISLFRPKQHLWMGNDPKTAAWVCVENNR